MMKPAARALKRFLKLGAAVFVIVGSLHLVSIATHGVPPPMILVLLLTELLLPPLLHVWLSRALR